MQEYVVQVVNTEPQKLRASSIAHARCLATAMTLNNPNYLVGVYSLQDEEEVTFDRIGTHDITVWQGSHLVCYMKKPMMNRQWFLVGAGNNRLNQVQADAIACKMDQLYQEPAEPHRHLVKRYQS